MDHSPLFWYTESDDRFFSGSNTFFRFGKRNTSAFARVTRRKFFCLLFFAFFLEFFWLAKAIIRLSFV
jgi:hypothetical protein